MANRAERRAARRAAASAGPRSAGRRSTVPALLVLLAVAGLILLALAVGSFGITNLPAPTPGP